MRTSLGLMNRSGTPKISRTPRSRRPWLVLDALAMSDRLCSTCGHEPLEEVTAFGHVAETRRRTSTRAESQHGVPGRARSHAAAKASVCLRGADDVERGAGPGGRP